MLNLKEKRYVNLDLIAKSCPLTDEKMTELENIQKELEIKPCDYCEGTGEKYVMTAQKGWFYDKCPHCYGLGEVGHSDKLRNKMLLMDYKCENKVDYDWFGIQMAVEKEFMKNDKLSVIIIKDISESFNIEKSIVQIAVNEFMEDIRKCKWCEATNHGNGKYIVSDDYGGPESGYMGYHCKKCGFSNGNQLY